MPLLEKSFGDWRANGRRSDKGFLGRAAGADRRRSCSSTVPNTPQSLIFAGQLLPVQGTDDIHRR